MGATISADYLRLQQELHRNPSYGVASLHYAPLVKTLMEIGGLHSVSDYGAGKTRLRARLHELGTTNFEYFPYDPAFPDYGPPKPADLVCCIDVLEHIEPDRLEAVLDELASITKGFGFFTIHCGPAHKILPDGRNAHLIQEPRSWWLPKLHQRFDVKHLQPFEQRFWIIVQPLGANLAVLKPKHIRQLQLAEQETLLPQSTSQLERLMRKLGIIRVAGRIAKLILTPAQYDFLRRKLK